MFGMMLFDGGLLTFAVASGTGSSWGLVCEERALFKEKQRSLSRLVKLVPIVCRSFGTSADRWGEQQQVGARTEYICREEIFFSSDETQRQVAQNAVSAAQRSKEAMRNGM